MNTADVLEAVEAYAAAAPDRLREAHGLLRSEIEQGEHVSPSTLSAVIAAQESDRAARNICNVLDATSGQSPEAQLDAVRMITQMNLRQVLSLGRSTSGIHDLMGTYQRDAWARIAGIVGVV